MAITTTARETLAHAFQTRSVDVVLQLLGFEPPGSHVPLELPGECRFCGTRGVLACYLIRNGDVVVHARALRNPLQLQLLVSVDESFDEIRLATYALGQKLLTLSITTVLRASEVDTFQEMVPYDNEVGSALAARYARALDRARVTRRFFCDFAAQRDNVSRTWSGIPAQSRKDRDQLALLFLSRLMFLFFLQHRGYLSGDRSFLLHRFEQRERKRSFFVSTLKPLFFEVLNRRPEQRTSARFADLPYLNGGLFERHRLEGKHSSLDLPDDSVSAAFQDLLERYQFTTRETAEAELEGVVDLGVDPEMLGRVFEGLMAESVRESTGTFYTPAATVDRLVANSINALPASLVARGDIRILDPACGSGAFLLGALVRVANLRAKCSASVLHARHHLVAHSLYGVDVQSDAALLCALRLWLALVPATPDATVYPLPNLDRHVRQGDALVDPLDLKAAGLDSEVRRQVNQLQPMLAEYACAEPATRRALHKTLQQAERRLTKSWLVAQRRRLDQLLRELQTLANEKDLFGETTTPARQARDQIPVVRERIAELSRYARRAKTSGDVPFFSFGVHFATAGFDLILCNPPWVRSHIWTRNVPSSVRSRFAVCRDGGKQVDLAMLFLERAIDLLAPGGVLGIILPAKFMRSQSAAGARSLIMRTTELLSLEDHSLDQRSVFEADAFTSVLVLRKSPPQAGTRTAVTMFRRNSAPQEFTILQHELAGDVSPGAPWLIVPAEVRRVLRKMSEAPSIADHGLLVQRGIVTGNNSALILQRVERKIGGLALIRAEGAKGAEDPTAFDAVVEESAIAPLLRGADVRPNVATASSHVLCRNLHSARTLPRAAKYAARHNTRIPRFDCPQHKVVWHDLASNLNAAVVAPDVVPLNTVYFIPASYRDAVQLCAFFNSLPIRVFARAIAERAKDAHFRFFGWTMASIPLPANWKTAEPSDEGVAGAFGLGAADMRAIHGFDEWLRS